MMITMCVTPPVSLSGPLNLLPQRESQVHTTADVLTNFFVAPALLIDTDLKGLGIYCL